MSNLLPPNDHPPPYTSNDFFDPAGPVPSPSAPTFSDLSISGQQNKESQHAPENHEYPGAIHAQRLTYPHGYAPLSQQDLNPPPTSYGYHHPATHNIGYDQELSQPRQVTVQHDQPRQSYDWTMCTSIVVCLCCFWPLGIAAIIFASQARSSTDTTQAACYARTSWILSIMSVVAGVIAIALIITYGI